MQITIYHNPNCSTSRNVLAAIRTAGHEPRVVEYLKTPFSRDELKSLIQRMDITARDLIRTKETLYKDLDLSDRDVGESELLDAMVENPSLINRPIVVTEMAAKLCRPSETIHELLAQKTS